MSKVKVKKQDTFIDMTAMSDVTVLLLTFFMLTATFIPKEPIQVITPQSVSEIKVPEYDVMTILIDPRGKVYMNIDRTETKRETLERMGGLYGLQFTPKQVNSFIAPTTFIGVPMREMRNFLDKPLDEQDELINNFGIPADSTGNQLAQWIRTAKDVNPDLTIAIKADQNTAYPHVKNVISTLQDMKENRYSLITNLRGMPEGL